ncbi:uncharacterized protein MELLADRAFT_106551 [Melampsora larici-populina 98AG31]|uniref:Uncharacterized protein n=1 Tax=Melampsora larici-populina (strain 98AG31 / pathotype 3-4-7) TaxID=747676 RepID=F4RLV6_MELLP|nr:uncharacterized protein MELLADRAFT_106551 [Melampsora larici-populina 98AG31]EGG06691.1 hypothetical protein MELLADRAFT_106551 [Melampsora larici-populina 98AG31]
MAPKTRGRSLEKNKKNDVQDEKDLNGTNSDDSDDSSSSYQTKSDSDSDKSEPEPDSEDGQGGSLPKKRRRRRKVASKKTKKGPCPQLEQGILIAWPPCLSAQAASSRVGHITHMWPPQSGVPNKPKLHEPQFSMPPHRKQPGKPPIEPYPAGKGNSKRTALLPDRFKPEKPGYHYQNRFNYNSMVDQFVRQSLVDDSLGDITPEVIDFDLAVTFFLFETNHLSLPNIPQSIDIVLNDLDILFPINSRQHDIETCALYIKSTIIAHESQPGSERPFGLRYPNFKALQVLIAERSKSPRPLNSNKAIVLVDLAGRFLAMGLPPNAKASVAAVSGLKALEGSAHLHALPGFIGPINKNILEAKISSSDSAFSPSISATARHSNLGNYPVPVPGALNGHLAYETYGFGLGSPDALADTKMELGFDRQGYRLEDCGDWPNSDRHLPKVMGLGEDCLFKRVDNARRIQQLHWAYEVSRVVNAAVQPETYEVAENFEYVYVSGQHVNYNIQVAPHRDGKNSNLIDSVFAYGRDYSGGRWNFGSLGVSFCADPGYSLHARFKFLDHSVATILPIPGSRNRPLRVSVALYSHADVYASTARVSGARSDCIGRARYSDGSMRLPFPPPGFSVPTFRKVLRKEEKKWRHKARAASAAHQAAQTYLSALDI